MSEQERREYWLSMVGRYALAGRIEKGIMLDEYCDPLWGEHRGGLLLDAHLHRIFIPDGLSAQPSGANSPWALKPQ